MEKEEIFKIIGIGGCLFFAYLGFFIKRKRERLISTGIPVEGVIFELKSDGDHETPVIRFTTLQNEWITKEYMIGFTQGQLKEGQKVNVYYNSDKPSDFVIDIAAQKWLPFIFISAGILGTILLLVSVFTNLL